MSRRAVVTTVTLGELHQLLGIPSGVEIRDVRMDLVRNRLDVLLHGPHFPTVLDNCEPTWVPLSEVRGAGDA